jgi:acetolactate synthase I/II/III large subunit
MNGASVTVEALSHEGVPVVFGLPGTTIMHLIDALYSSPVRYVTVRHEQVASFMADGYARASGSVGVCMASRGPGAANLSIGVHNAYAESVPLLVLLGQVADDIYYREAFEEMDLVRFFEPVTKHAFEVHTPSRIAELTQRAIRLSTSGRPGPVLVSLPLDVLTASVPTGGASRTGSSDAAATAELAPVFRPAAPAPDAAAVSAAASLLAGARRPVIIAGGGMNSIDGFDPGLLSLASALQAPVVTTWLRKNVFPNDSPLFCGSLGYGAVSVTDSLVREADVVLALGCRFSEFATQRWTLLSSESALIHVDVDPDALGRVYIPSIGICADARATTAALAAALSSTLDGSLASLASRAERAAASRTAYLAQTVMPSPPDGLTTVSSAGIIAVLRSVLDDDTILVQDAPGLGTWIHRYLDFTAPGTFFAPAGGSMGWGMPAGMGIQLARPSSRVITVNGDGSFWMVAQDLETAVRENLPVVNIICNNFSFGNTRDRQRTAHGGRYHGVFYGNPDFAEFARLLGAHGERVEHDRDLLPAIKRALDSGLPAVIDCIQDQHEGLPPDLVPPAAR